MKAEIWRESSPQLAQVLAKRDLCRIQFKSSDLRVKLCKSEDLKMPVTRAATLNSFARLNAI